jgi:hypothetical protein
LKLFSLPDDIEKLVVSGLKPLAEFTLSFLPVFGKGRFSDALSGIGYVNLPVNSRARPSARESGLSPFPAKERRNMPQGARARVAFQYRPERENSPQLLVMKGRR